MPWQVRELLTLRKAAERCLSLIYSELRITTLVDVYDALRSARPYKPAMTHEQAMNIILEGYGRTDPKHFRPDVLEAFKNANDAMNHIFETMAD